MISKPKITHVRPKKRLGQHFLRRKEIAQKIVDALEVGAEDTLIEVGAGTGELTRLIVKKAGKVVAVEVDETCFPTLQVLADLNPNLELFLDDVRKLDLADYREALVLGNLPYHLSAEILFWLLDQRDYWKKAVLTVQAEFADRLVAEVGSHDYSALSVVFQTFLEVEKLFDIPSSAFVPPPKVKSTTIRIKPLEGVELPVSEDRFIKFVRACFTHRRKRLANNLKIMGIPSPDKLLGKLGHSPTVRPQELSSHDYIELTGSLA